MACTGCAEWISPWWSTRATTTGISASPSRPISTPRSSRSPASRAPRRAGNPRARRALQGMLKQLGGPDRPLLGDRSLAAPLLRAEGLANERRLTEITLDLCRRLGIEALVLPMSDDPVRTNVLTDDGAMTFQQYYNELGCDPAVLGLQ